MISEIGDRIRDTNVVVVALLERFAFRGLIGSNSVCRQAVPDDGDNAAVATVFFAELICVILLLLLLLPLLSSSSLSSLMLSLSLLSLTIAVGLKSVVATRAFEK